ncbi:DSD1 family PLP-dependent enzyme [SAR202 cluster bacterium AD-804-J14_MRT_500m]|nr:DSD1 family PLP-dependent enzyme [SAR202 cluster bacterium AD-804-J14_MRT_500m]
MNPRFPVPGTRLEDLDTPCLIIDMDALEHNIGVMAEFYKERTTKLRPHTKNHKSPMIAHMQLRAGGTVGGICTAKVSEAEVMVQGGINQVFIANQIVTKDKIARLVSLARRAEIIVAADDVRNVHDLADATQKAGIELGVIVEVDTQMGRCGVRTVDQGIEVAQAIDSKPYLKMRGVMSHQTIAPTSDREMRVRQGRQMIEKVIDLKDSLDRIDIPVEIVSTGETWSYDVAADIPGVTEIQGGSYLLMEAGYSFMSEFRYACKLLGTVISAVRPGRAIGDIGIKSVGTPKGLPIIEDNIGTIVEELHAEHVILNTENGPRLSLGDKFALIPGQQDIMVNRWDTFIAVRGGEVEAIWDIPGRGCHN